jgi:hypothetical protein
VSRGGAFRAFPSRSSTNFAGAASRCALKTIDSLDFDYRLYVNDYKKCDPAFRDCVRSRSNVVVPPMTAHVAREEINATFGEKFAWGDGSLCADGRNGLGRRL